MIKKHWVVWAIVGLALLQPVAVWSQKEIEPNNAENQANPVNAGTIEARANDSHDWFKVSLPATGPVTIRVTGLPQKMNVQIGVKGLAPLKWRDGQGDTEYSFEATKTEGLVWVMFQFVQSVCGYDWCAARMVPGGPLYGVRPSERMPDAHNGEPIIKEALPYRLIIETAATAAAADTTTVAPDAAAMAQDDAIQWEDEPEEDPPAPPGQIIWEDEWEENPDNSNKIFWEEEQGIGG